MPRLNIERQEKLEPARMKHTQNTLEELGFVVTSFKNRLEFPYHGSVVRFWPYSGWFTGKTVTDGRGFKKLLKQIQNG